MPLLFLFCGHKFRNALDIHRLLTLGIGNIYKEKNPTSYLVCIGPKSIRRGKKEIFDPYINSSVDELILTNVSANGEALKEEEKEKYIHEIVFEDIYGENKEAAFGRIKSLVLKTV